MAAKHVKIPQYFFDKMMRREKLVPYLVGGYSLNNSRWNYPDSPTIPVTRECLVVVRIVSGYALSPAESAGDSTGWALSRTGLIYHRAELQEFWYAANPGRSYDHFLDGCNNFYAELQKKRDADIQKLEARIKKLQLMSI